MVDWLVYIVFNTVFNLRRVNFKGCVEKDELLKIVERLWKQEQRNKSNIETMDDESLCKICMDSPVSWWIRFSSVSPNILCSDWLCYAGVWAHVYLYAVWQADGRVSYMQAVCCKVSVSNTYRVIQWNWNKFWVYYSDQEATYGIKETKTVMQFSNSARDVYTT